MTPATAAADHPVLSLQGVSRTFGTLVAVRDVSFDVRSGEVFGLAGPNGAGKSTLFNVITGIPFGPDAGSRVLLDGRDIVGRPAWAVARAGLVRTFQTEAVFEDLTVLQNVRVAASASARGMRGRLPESRVRAALDTVGLPDPGVSAKQLSLVDRKRLMIATAIVSEPKLLLLDEPAGGLEPSDQDQLITLLRTINAQGITIVIVEHVLRVLRTLCGRMAVLDAGAVIASGTPEDVLADPAVVEAYLGPGGGQ